MLVEHMQQFFNDRSLNYQVVLEEKAGDQEPVERPLNTREQFLKMAEAYPLVKELKDRLRLELDY
jgi:DNA polymerase-3 subunit gamma/tau